MNRTDLLSAGAHRKNLRTGRVSSWDHAGEARHLSSSSHCEIDWKSLINSSGLNEDAFMVRPGESIVLADIEGYVAGLQTSARRCLSLTMRDLELSLIYGSCKDVERFLVRVSYVDSGGSDPEGKRKS
jgi:hypothetical protein